jgi:hypothetical protein
MTWDVVDRDGKLVGTFPTKTAAREERDRLNAAARGEATSSSLKRAMAEIEETNQLRKFLAAPATEGLVVHTDIEKSAAIAVTKRFDDRVEAIAQRDRIGFPAAMLKIASANGNAVSSEVRADYQLWLDYRKAQDVIAATTPAPVVAAPVPTVSPAFQKMAQKAQKLAEKEGISQAAAFAKIYQQRPDLARADKQHFFNKAAGFGAQPVDPDEELVRALIASLSCSESHARGLALELRSKKPNLGTLARSGVAA